MTRFRPRGRGRSDASATWPAATNPRSVRSCGRRWMRTGTVTANASEVGREETAGDRAVQAADARRIRVEEIKRTGRPVAIPTRRPRYEPAPRGNRHRSGRMPPVHPHGEEGRPAARRNAETVPRGREHATVGAACAGTGRVRPYPDRGTHHLDGRIDAPNGHGNHSRGGVPSGHGTAFGRRSPWGRDRA